MHETWEGRIGNRLRTARVALQLSEDQVAVILCTSPRTYQKWESGGGCIRLGHLIAFCRATGVSPNWLFGDNGSFLIRGDRVLQ
jgi:transcriptional regulator with XRE-family HTH domain